MSKSYTDLALIRSGQANLEWCITIHSKKLQKQAYDLILKICQDLNDRVDNLHHFRRFELLKDMNTYLYELIKKDSIAHAIDMRIIYNLPKEENLNARYVIKAAPYNITYNDQYKRKSIHSYRYRLLFKKFYTHHKWQN